VRKREGFMKNTRKLIALFMVLAMILGCVACSSNSNTDTPSDKTAVDDKTADDKKDNTDATDNTAATGDTDDADDAADVEEEEEEEEDDFEYPEVILGADGKPVDLGGMEVTIGAWWSDAPLDDSTAYGEATLKYRKWLEDTYHFTVKVESIGSWSDYPGLVTNFCTTGGDENYVFVIDYRSFAGYKSGLFKDLTQYDCLDFTEEKWDKEALTMLKDGDAIYAMRSEKPEPRGGIFFNKRLLLEAGVDPETLYDMQAAGTWDWAAFEELCAKLTRDTNGDDIPDIYAMASINYDFMKPCLASNNAWIVERDENGNFVNGTGKDNFLQAWDWAKDLRSKYEMPRPEEANWDYAYSSFLNAEVALQAAEEYRVTNIADLPDDFGFVVFPKGPACDSYMGYSEDHLRAIPAIYDDDRAWKIAFAFNLYTEPTPGYEDQDEDWKTNYYPQFRDTRAVDETLAILREDEKPQYYVLVNHVNQDNNYFYNIDSKTGQEQYEEMKDEIDYYIEQANNN